MTFLVSSKSSRNDRPYSLLNEAVQLSGKARRPFIYIACSWLSIAGDERKRARKKRGRTKARSGGRACKTFFNDPLLV